MSRWKLAASLLLLGGAMAAMWGQEAAAPEKKAGEKQNAEQKSAEQKTAKGDADRGNDLFFDHCFDCHDPSSEDFKNGPGLRGIKKSGKLPSGRPATHEIILNQIDYGVEEMPGFKDILKPQEKEDLIAFLLTL